MTSTLADRAEQLAKRRSYVAILTGTMLIVTQGQRMGANGGSPVSWAITGVVVAIFIVWASGMFRNSILRGILNDESSDANRKRSLMIGFWNMLAAAVVCYALSFLKDYGPRDAIQVIMSVGMSSALIGFGISEQVSARS